MATKQMAWAEKYRPKTIEELIFPNKQIENAVKKWYENKKITENALLYGKPGTGKSSLIKILVKDFIKNEKDVFILGRKVDDIEKLGGWINAAPIASAFKIVVIEEADRLSAAAFLQLKEKYMEKYQGKVAFLATTNNPHKVDPAVRTRFNLKINFDQLPVDGVLQRITTVLQTENIKFNTDQLAEFVNRHIRKGMRELLNLLQIASINGEFNPNAVSQLAGVTQEDKIIQVAEYLLKYMLQLNSEQLNVIYKNALNDNFYEVFGKYWKWLADTLNQFADIDYDYLYSELINEKQFPLNIKRILMQYYNDNEFKIYKNMHFMSALIAVIEDLIEIKE